MGVGILAKRVVLELSSSTNFVYSLKQYADPAYRFAYLLLLQTSILKSLKLLQKAFILQIL